MKGQWIRFPAEDSRKSFSLGIIPVLLLLWIAGCNRLEPVPTPAPPSVFDIGLAHLANGDFTGAELAFRDAASRCESGSDGRRALLFLSILSLDPRNTAAHPDSAALMAARFLNLPSNTREEVLEAEALYIAALDYGADPELRIDPVNPGFAVRFGDCDQPFPPRDDRPLPTLESSTSGRLRSLDEERDALTQENQELRYTVRRLRTASDSLQARVEALEAELGRIRQLIRLPDTTAVRRPPDTTLAPSPDVVPSRIPGIGMDHLPFGP